MRKVLFLLILFLVAGCSISQQEAENAAVKFVSSNIKFYSRAQNSSDMLPKTRIDSVTSYEENRNWIVMMHVSSDTLNGTKKGDISVKINSKGEPIELNGKNIKDIEK